MNRNFKFLISDFRLMGAWYWVFGVSAMTCTLALPAFAQDTTPAKPAKPAKSLDKQLLDDLDAGLPESLDNLKAKTGENTPAKKPASDLDNKLKQDLGEGEDIEFGKPQDPLAKIGDRMREAEQLIGKRNTSIKTQTLQREILTDLDALIAKLEKQCQCAGGQKQQSKPQQNSSQAKKPGKSDSDSGEESKKPADDSTERIGKNDDSKVEAQDMHELVRAVWGNLPARVRQQMQSASVEQFLPKYERLIEEYYKRLAEDPK